MGLNGTLVAPSTTITNTYGGTADLDANFTSPASSEVTFQLQQSTIHPGKLTINGLNTTHNRFLMKDI